MTLKLKSGKVLSGNIRLLRQSELNLMGGTSPNNIYLEIIDPKKITSRNKKLNFKEDMPNLLYHDYSGSLMSRKNMLEQVKECIKSDSDFIVSSCGKNESLNDVKIRLELLEENYSKTKNMLFVLNYDSDNAAILALDEYKDNIDIIGIHVGCYFYGNKGFDKLTSKILLLRRLINKPIFLFGVPVKVSGDHQSDVRFLPFYQLLVEAWGKYWRPVDPKESQLRSMDKDSYACLTYQQCISKYGSPGYQLPGTGKTIYEFYKNSSPKNHTDYWRITLDEELAMLQSKNNPNELQNFILDRVHPNFVSGIMNCWKEKGIEDSSIEISNVIPDWNVKDVQVRLKRTVTKAPPGTALWATQLAFDWLKENVEKHQEPSFTDFINVVDVNLNSPTSGSIE